MFADASDSVDRALLATLAYANAVGMPLTAMQVHRRLIALTRFGAPSVSPSLGQVVQTLDRLAEHGAVRVHDGWYAPAGTSIEATERRLEHDKVQADKWRRMRRKAFWMQAVPFVRAICAAGSLAEGKTGPESDWDMFVVTRRGRLYTSRIFLLGVAKFLRVLRTKKERIAPDKFCFNHYVTDDGLSIRHRSLFVAYALSALVPIHDPDHMARRLWEANRWAGDFLAHWPPADSITVQRKVRRSRALRMVRRTAEALLSNPLGNVFEHVMRRWQQGRIEREPATHARGGRIVADRRELEFHPRSAERAALSRYNAAMAALGVAAQEQDSGLR
jgi:hypothetical protein